MTPRLVPAVAGAALVAIGAVLLLRNVGILPTGVSVWPVVVIAAGVMLVAVGLWQQQQGEPAPTAAVVALGGARTARLLLKHGAGALDVTAGGDGANLLEGTFAGGVREEVQHRGEQVTVTLRHPSDPEQLIRQYRGLHWSVAINGEVPLELDVQTGASRVRLDLERVALHNLRVQAGASEIDVRLPARGRCAVRVGAGAADVRLHVPEGVAAAITSRSALATVSVDQARFPARDGGYFSPDYDTAEHRVDIDLEGGVGSFRVD